mmetsp:Transcript_8124/g.20997  ORF Transcript_8124/g.20997 Transcript_8124/m.20997 type:complete len:623 (-) Transcript_8124:122-1990(-)
MEGDGGMWRPPRRGRIPSADTQSAGPSRGRADEAAGEGAHRGYRKANNADHAGLADNGKSAVDRLLEQKLLNDLRNNPPPQVPAPGSRIKSGRLGKAAGARAGSNSGQDKDEDLVSSMMRRLTMAEREIKLKNQQLTRVRSERDELRIKVDELLQELQDRDEQMAAMPPPPAANASSIIEELRAENQRLRGQNDRAWDEVGYLKEFLGDYGMVWMGKEKGMAPAKDSPSPGASSDEEDAQRAKQPAPWQQYMGGKVQASQADLGEDEWQVPQPKAQQAQSFGSEPHGSSLEKLAEMPFEMAELHTKIKELNDLAGDGCFDVVKNTRGAHLLAPDPVVLIVYADGLKLHTHKFCKYEEKVCKSLVADIMDGYFPAALKHEFPEGVPLKVVDKSSDPYPVGFKAFHGIGNVLTEQESKPNPKTGGYTLGGHGGAAQGAQPAARIRGMNDLGNQGPQDAAKFLDKLPQAVIRNGKIIDVRSDIAAMLGAEKHEVEMAFVKTPVDELLTTMQRKHAGPSLPPQAASASTSAAGHAGSEAGPAQAQITTLQVKREDGGQVYIVKLRYTSTIADLRRALDAHRAQTPEFASIQYQIRSAFPARMYDNPQQTLEDAELVPNAALFLRPQ